MQIKLGELLGVAPNVASRTFKRVLNPDHPENTETTADPGLHHVDFEEELEDGQRVKVRSVHVEPENGSDTEADLSGVTKVFASVPSPQAKIEIGDLGLQTAAIIDEGSCVNVISKDLAEKTGSPYYRGLSIDMTGVGSKSVFVGIYDRMKIKLGNVTHYVPFFVLPVQTRVLLGLPVYPLARMGAQNCDNGAWEGTVHTLSGDSVTWTGRTANALPASV